jgi:hypothetical protein
MIELAASCIRWIRYAGSQLARRVRAAGEVAAKVAGKPDDLCDINAPRVRCQVADLHIVDHPTAKRAHRQSFARTASATWRQRIVSQLSFQTKQDVFRGSPIKAVKIRDEV